MALCRLSDARRGNPRCSWIRIDFRSILVPEAGSVYVDRIAVAPRNRSWLVAIHSTEGSAKDCCCIRFVAVISLASAVG